VQAKVREGSLGGRSKTMGNNICEKGRLNLSREWKRKEVMDEQRCESKEEEVIGEVVCESELVPEWGWRKDKGSWFQRQVKHTERSDK